MGTLRSLMSSTEKICDANTSQLSYCFQYVQLVGTSCSNLIFDCIQGYKCISWLLHFLYFYTLTALNNTRL